MGGWVEPEDGLFSTKQTQVEEASDSEVIYLHDQMHVYWQKLIDGFSFSWTFNEVLDKHTETVLEMADRGLRHIFPINSLDEVPITKRLVKKDKVKKNDNKQTIEVINLNKKDKYAVDRKFKGKKFQAHKKNGEIKIFSEDQKELTKEYSEFLEDLNKLSKEDFVVDCILLEDNNEKKISVLDIAYFKEPIDQLTLEERSKIYWSLSFEGNIICIDRKIHSGNEEFKNLVEWSLAGNNSIGATVRNLNSNYWSKGKIIAKKDK